MVNTMEAIMVRIKMINHSDGEDVCSCGKNTEEQKDSYSVTCFI